MIDWRRVPWTLWVYVLLNLGGLGRIMLRLHHTPAPLIAFFVAFELTWLFFLLKGVRWLWIATAVVSGLGFLQTVVFGPRIWWSLILALVTFGLLIAPSTRLFFAKNQEAVAVA